MPGISPGGELAQRDARHLAPCGSRPRERPVSSQRLRMRVAERVARQLRQLELGREALFAGFDLVVDDRLQRRLRLAAYCSDQLPAPIVLLD